MATRKEIITLPHKSLRERSKRVSMITNDTRSLVDKMTTIGLDWEAHHEHEVTVGLAAVQINKLERIVIIRNNFDNKEDKEFTALINPEIAKTDGEPIYELEGCLSVAGFYGRVKRYPKVKIKALSLDGKPIRITATGFLAKLLQHEVDHINGKTYIDRLDKNGELYRMQEDGKLNLLDLEEYKKVLAKFKPAD